MIYSKLYDLLATQAWHKNPTRSNPLETSITQQKTDKRLPVCFCCERTIKKIFLWFVLRIRTQTQNHGIAVDIINSEGIAYHQCGALYIIIAKEDTACG